MTITPEDVGRNSFNLFAVGRNAAVDTPEGVKVSLSRHSYAHLAGSKQKMTRQRWGLIMGPVDDCVVIIAGQTVDSLLVLKRQYEEQRKTVVRAAQQAAVLCLEKSHKALNEREKSLGVPLTSTKDINVRFDEPFDRKDDAEQATTWLIEQKMLLDVACNSLPQIMQLRSVFPREEFRFFEEYLSSSDESWHVSYDLIHAVVSDPSLVENLASKMDLLYEEFEKLVLEARYELFDLYGGSENNFVIGSVDATEQSDEDARKEFCVKFDLEIGGVQFYWGENSFGGRSSLSEVEGKFHSLNIDSGNYNYHSHMWCSVDALFFMQSLVDRMKIL